MSAANNQVITNLKNSIKNLIIPYELILTCDKETINSDDNESATVTATLTDKKTGLPVQDELLLYSIYDSDYNLLDHGVLTTDNNGEASVVYVAGGLGDVNVTFSLRTVLQKTYVIKDTHYYEIVDCSNPKSVTSQSWPTPLEVTGKIIKNGGWGGTRIYGSALDTSQRYCWLSQNTINDESAKIFYTVDYTWRTFRVVIDVGSVSLYIDDKLIKSVNCDTTGTAHLYAGSSANPVSLSDVKIKPL